MANLLKEKADVFAVGVTSDIDDSFLSDISSGGVKDVNWFQIDSFEGLKEIIDPVVQQACITTTRPTAPTATPTYPNTCNKKLILVAIAAALAGIMIGLIVASLMNCCGRKTPKSQDSKPETGEPYLSPMPRPVNEMDSGRYGSETWNFSKPSCRKIKSFELWCYRQILKISWSIRVTNDAVEDVQEERFYSKIFCRSSSFLQNVIYEGLQGDKFVSHATVSFAIIEIQKRGKLESASMLDLLKLETTKVCLVALGLALLYLAFTGSSESGYLGDERKGLSLSKCDDTMLAKSDNMVEESDFNETQAHALGRIDIELLSDIDTKSDLTETRD
ncbi:hypothetical protein CAPTEDRAFT_198252 [Capitella teleta]|uniref:VWFA domain-containing protein n=1 Tax=Capitella teleta TaxID=283909 RepID=R7UDF5_CAPTE|nr:hypothetical protein CAPTEDRAFT_198252 [Capitella teleta]|eukprot:ELU03999.1 hypothetical protein CAPTEDRAFT_198252 [Capitella teleta]